MFRYFSNGLFLFHGTMFALVSSFTLRDFRDAVTNATVDVDEFEAITAASNAGSFCIAARMEPAFMLAFALQLICAAAYIPPESRGVPALAACLGCCVLAHSCYLISTNTLGVKVFPGDFVAMFQPLFYANTGFAIGYAFVAAGTFLGFAKKAKTD